MGAADIDLLAAWQSGDESAGQALFKRHFQALYRFFRNKVGDDADELIQRTFLAAVRGSGSFRGDSSFRTYLFVIARHELYAHCRERAKQQARFDPEHSTLHGTLSSPSDRAARNEVKDIVHAALRMVPVNMQVALELHYWEDLSATEMAQVLEVPEGTVKSRLQRGRAALFKEIRRLMKRAGLAAAREEEIERALGL